MLYVETTGPTVEPISVSDVKSWLKIATDMTVDDTLIGYLITTARLQCEMYCNRAFVNTTFTGFLEDFSTDDTDIVFPRSSVSSVTSVKYYDSNNVEQTLSSSVYVLNNKTSPSRLSLVSGQSWPFVYDRFDAISIVFVAGYGATAAAVPEDIKTALKFYVGKLYANRATGENIGTPQEVLKLLGRRRVIA